MFSGRRFIKNFWNESLVKALYNSSDIKNSHATIFSLLVTSSI